MNFNEINLDTQVGVLFGNLDQTDGDTMELGDKRFSEVSLTIFGSAAVWGSRGGTSVIVHRPGRFTNTNDATPVDFLTGTAE